MILTRSIVAPKTNARSFKFASDGNFTPNESESVNACFAHPFQSQVIAPTSTPPEFEI